MLLIEFNPDRRPRFKPDRFLELEHRLMRLAHFRENPPRRRGITIDGSADVPFGLIEIGRGGFEFDRDGSDRLILGVYGHPDFRQMQIAVTGSPRPLFRKRIIAEQFEAKSRQSGSLG